MVVGLVVTALPEAVDPSQVHGGDSQEVRAGHKGPHPAAEDADSTLEAQQRLADDSGHHRQQEHHRRMPQAEEQPHTVGRTPQSQQLPDGVIDHRDAVGVPGVPQPKQVGGQAHAP